MPGRITHMIPAAMSLGGADQSVVLLVFADDQEAVTRWMRELLVYRLAISGKVMSTDGGSPLAVLRVHPDRLAEIHERRAECVRDLAALPRDLLANL